MDDPDIQIGALVKAKRLRFKKKPETEVRVKGEGGSGSLRENLPETVEPGVTYRDVRVAWLATAGRDPNDHQDNTNEGDDDGEKQRT